jgi:hypothetical protein
VQQGIGALSPHFPGAAVVALLSAVASATVLVPMDIFRLPGLNTGHEGLLAC